MMSDTRVWDVPGGRCWVRTFDAKATIGGAGANPLGRNTKVVGPAYRAGFIPDEGEPRDVLGNGSGYSGERAALGLWREHACG